MKKTITIITALFAPYCLAHAGLSENQAMRAIIGEAGNQTDQAMLGVACALHNRGTLHGVYGAARVPSGFHAMTGRSQVLRARALRAWHKSAKIDITAGCRYFGCPQDAPYFLRKLHFRPVLTIGAITFYRP